MKIERDKYLNELNKEINSNLPKVITGIRRCGKSYLLKQIFKDDLLLKKIIDNKNQIIYLNLDEIKNRQYRNPLKLYDYITNKTKNKNKKYFVFIDEIQRVQEIQNDAFKNVKFAENDNKSTVSFVDVVLDLSNLENINLYITGSNSKFLSTDIVTEFRGRSENIKLSPLSFEEFHKYKNGSESDDLQEYLQFGGMPSVVLKENENDKRKELKKLYDNVYINDIIERNKLKDNEKNIIKQILEFISKNNGKGTFSLKNIKNTINQNIDESTIKTYLDYCVDSFILEKISKYNAKSKEDIFNNEEKYYFTDIGLKNAISNFQFDVGKNLENFIYNQLTYNEYNVNFDKIYYKENNKTRESKIDFIAEKNIDTLYIQVTNDISNETTYRRKIKPFLLTKEKQNQKIVVIKNYKGKTKDKNGFIFINAVDFVLNFIKRADNKKEKELLNFSNKKKLVKLHTLEKIFSYFETSETEIKKNILNLKIYLNNNEIPHHEYLKILWYLFKIKEVGICKLEIDECKKKIINNIKNLKIIKLEDFNFCYIIKNIINEGKIILNIKKFDKRNVILNKEKFEKFSDFIDQIWKIIFKDKKPRLNNYYYFENNVGSFSHKMFACRNEFKNGHSCLYHVGIKKIFNLLKNVKMHKILS